MSSEALEHARYFHVPQDSLRPRSALEADPPWPSFDVVHRMDYDALLAEVARLKQERDERIATATADEWLLHRFNETWDALAVAREREQRLRAALDTIDWLLHADRRNSDPGEASKLTRGEAIKRNVIELARAALADEPAAAALACPECGEPLQLGHDCLAGPARAAADEPGETP